MKDSEFKTMVMDAVDKLLTQGQQSIDYPSTGCVYRSSEGLCCVVGFMLDDETARTADNMGESSVTDIIHEGLWGEDLTGSQVDQLVRLQGCHDFVDNIRPFNEEFIDAVKAENKLTWVAEHIGAKG